MNPQFNSHLDLQIVDWNEGEEQYQEDFKEMILMFGEQQMIELLQKSLEGAETNDWALFLSQIHRLKGSASYVSALQITAIGGDAQEFLLAHIVKVNPRGKTPAEQYQVQESFQTQEKYISLQFFVLLLEACQRFYQELASKQIVIDANYQNMIPSFTQQTKKLLQQFDIFHKTKSLCSNQSSRQIKQQQSLKSKILDQEQNKTSTQDSQDKQQQKQEYTQPVLDRPQNNESCCQKCIIF